MRPTDSSTFAFGKETLNFILNINLLLINKTNDYEKNFDDAISIRWHVGNDVVYEYWKYIQRRLYYLCRASHRNGSLSLFPHGTRCLAFWYGKARTVYQWSLWQQVGLGSYWV